VDLDVVRVWLIRTDRPAPAMSAFDAVLDDPERRRAAALRDPADRRRFVVAHGALRIAAARLLDVPAPALRWHRGVHCKPVLAAPPAPLHVSLAHCGDLAMLALCGRRAVGVDVQRVVRGSAAVGLADRYFTAAEARFVAAAAAERGRATRFTRLWTRKEACVKAAGGRLTQGLTLSVLGEGSVVVDRAGAALAGPYLVSDVPVPRGFLASVAGAGRSPYRVLPRWWR
jgi:4'-phosphopantetheinyl transferase